MTTRLLNITSALTVCFATGWGAVVLAQDTGSPRDFVSMLIDSFEAGVVCAQDGGTVRDAPGTVAGTTHVVEQAPPFVSNGRRVPAVLGIGFGVKSSVPLPSGLEDVTMTVTHPPFKGSGATEQSFVTRIGGEGIPGITFYQFDYDYELALGEWTMSAFANGVTLYHATFTVVPPAALPELASVCGYSDLLS